MLLTFETYKLRKNKDKQKNKIISKLASLA